MKFEYDKNKSQINKEKHGIDFVDDETRYALISTFKDKCYTAIFTLRDEIYRIISVRRCRKNEERNYEKNNS